MSLDATLLSSLASGIDDLERRAGDLAGALDGGRYAEAAVALYEVERSLAMAGRAVDRARRVVDAG
jgi:hypothetical protein